MKFTCEKCGWEIFADSVRRCPRCKDTGKWIEKKPKWARLIERLRIESDRGVGDTAQRIAAKFGGERFKAFAEKLGMPCGCSDRQDEWNQRFPYILSDSEVHDALDTNSSCNRHRKNRTRRC